MTMRMDGDYATTVAAVAPVILLVGAVEVSVYANMHRDAARAYRDDDTPGMYGMHFIKMFPVGVRAVGAGLSGLMWCCFVVLLCMAEVKSLKWLATQDAPPSPAEAEFCFGAIILGFAWVAFVPIARLLRTLLASTTKMIFDRTSLGREMARERHERRLEQEQSASP
ncbi:hypothetical protein V2J94_40075 [Streptomyces sp. DSM 41524]|uniref:Uncharacterized protein n=1 Tax=Streptomyces asiaticus subsp. ignotus TaxID=3098222 RepID=A0ABU7Q9D8_9ACTN|nr:hypothetical protein [Streptomyces sp. DSM 41524]